MKKELSEYLFRKNTYTYAVLDGASVPDLPVKLHEMRPPHLCLYRGELSPDLIYVAPYLVQIQPDAEFTNWLFNECWGRHWGIFAQSGLTMTGMRKHFRTLLTVYDETGKPLLFRYYDPRVFLTYIPTCSAAELELFFGQVKYYFAESDDAAKLMRYNFSKTELKQTTLDVNRE